MTFKTINHEPYKVSILLTIYNVEGYLEECLDSISKQSYTNLEVICVDNGSTDGTAAILSKFSKKDNRIKVVTLKDNVKLCSGRNVSMDAATGDFVLFVDPDDVIGRNYVRFMIDEYEIAKKEYPALKLVINQNAANYTIKDPTKDNVHKILEEPEVFNYFSVSDCFPAQSLFLDKQYVKEYPIWNFAIPMWARLYDREFLASNNIRFIDGEMLDNVPFTYIAMNYLDKWYMSRKTDDKDKWYYRRLDYEIYNKDEKELEEGPLNSGETTIDICYKSFDMPKCVGYCAKLATKLTVPFAGFFMGSYRKHRSRYRLLEEYKKLFEKIEQSVIENSKLYSKFDVDLIEAVLHSSYAEFDCTLYPKLEEQYLSSIENYKRKLLGKNGITKDKLRGFTHYQRYRLFNFLQFMKIKAGPAKASFYFFGIPLCGFKKIGNKITISLLGLHILVIKISKLI